jgi:apolipoprotein N-acyltransferase
MTFSPLTKLQQALLLLLSFIIVGFGQPAWSWPCSILASVIGYALFWRVLLGYSRGTHRFWLSTFWFFAVQLVQFSWVISHPYIYIYGVYFATAFVFGLQFGVIGLLINPQQVGKLPRLAAIAGLWVILEWTRLFILTGISWNPAGIALTANLLSLQMASLWGIYGLSFWVIFVNLLALKAFGAGLNPRFAALWLLAAALPYVYGGIHLNVHDHYMAQKQKEGHPSFNAVLVQTAFPVEETLPFVDNKQLIAYIHNEWRQILTITKQHIGKSTDLIVLPEFTVPCGTYTPVFPYEVVKSSFEEILGPQSVQALPALTDPLAYQVNTKNGPLWMVSNAFWLQGIANIFQADVIAGLEDAEDIDKQRNYYSSAQFFHPTSKDEPVVVTRYEKRVLVPMAEYIPFTFLKTLAAAYGIQSSFTPGTEAKLFNHHKLPLGVSICYEETFGHLIRENRQLGAELLVNLTSDVWYPNSRLPQQHLDHARLRTVENGIPLIRACNTGITCGLDSLGRMIAVLGDNPEQREWLSDSLHLAVPTYTYHTLYSRVGDLLILGISLISVLFFLRFRDFGG